MDSQLENNKYMCSSLLFTINEFDLNTTWNRPMQVQWHGA